jgi:hypothetical protein
MDQQALHTSQKVISPRHFTCPAFQAPLLEPNDGPGGDGLHREMHRVHQKRRRELPFVLPQHLLVVPVHTHTRTG